MKMICGNNHQFFHHIKNYTESQIGPACCSCSSSETLKIKIDFRTKLTISSTNFRRGNLNLNLSSLTKNVVAIFNMKWPKLCSTLRRRENIVAVQERLTRAKERRWRKKVIGCNSGMNWDAEGERSREWLHKKRYTHQHSWHRASDSNVFTSTLFKLLESHFPIADVIFMLNYTKKDSLHKIRAGRLHFNITQ